MQQSNETIRVLLIDDDKFLTIIYEKAFKKFQNVEVEVVHDAEEALDVFKKRPDAFDLLLIDYKLPKISGIELAILVQAIRADQNIQIWSGHCDDELKKNTENSGLQQCIEKPFGFEDGVNIIEKILAPISKKTPPIVPDKKQEYPPALRR